MKKLNQKIQTTFIVALIFSIMLPGGILATIFGATKGMTALMVIGIVCIVLGFYGTPMIWISYANKRGLRTILNLIENENIFTVTELSEQLSKRRQDIVSSINALITGGYLTGYLFKNNETLYLNTNQKQSKKNTLKTKCPNCGAMMDSDGLNFVCGYCGYVKREK